MHYTATITSADGTPATASADTAAQAIKEAGASVTRPIHTTVRVSVLEDDKEIFFVHDYGVPAAVKAALAMNRKSRRDSGR